MTAVHLTSVTQRVAGAIEIYDDAIPDTDQVIDILNQLGEWDSSRIGAGEGTLDTNIRSNDMCVINPFDFRIDERLYLFARNIWHYVNDYAVRHDATFYAMEPICVNRYYPGQRYLPHADAGPSHDRVISALVYLNDVADGGETEFVNFGVKVKPARGRLVIFPSNYAYRHAALPPLDGMKYAAAVWMRGN